MDVLSYAEFGFLDDVNKYLKSNDLYTLNFISDEISLNNLYTLYYKFFQGDKFDDNNFLEAAENGKTRLNEVINMIDSGVNVNVINGYGYTALMLACVYSNSNSSLETIKLLIKSGANVNTKNIGGNTALMIASQYSNDISNIETVDGEYPMAR